MGDVLRLSSGSLPRSNVAVPLAVQEIGRGSPQTRNVGGCATVEGRVTHAGATGLVRVVVDGLLNIVQDRRVIRRREHVSLRPKVELLENLFAEIGLEDSHVGASFFRGARRDMGHDAYADQIDDCEAAVRDVAPEGHAQPSLVGTPDFECYGKLREGSTKQRNRSQTQEEPSLSTRRGLAECHRQCKARAESYPSQLATPDCHNVHHQDGREDGEDAERAENGAHGHFEPYPLGGHIVNGVQAAELEPDDGEGQVERKIEGGGEADTEYGALRKEPQDPLLLLSAKPGLEVLPHDIKGAPGESDAGGNTEEFSNGRHNNVAVRHATPVVVKPSVNEDEQIIAVS